MFQKTSPSLFTAMTTFSGLVCVTTLRSFGWSTGICCAWTGIVIRKMMSSTSITSTSGVVLMAAITSCSWPSTSWPTVIAMADLLARGGDRAGGDLLVAAHEDHVKVGREGAQLLHRDLVAADQPVVAQHGRHRDREADGRHDERLAHGAGDLVDRGLAGDADGGEGVIDAPDRAEEAHEGRGGAHGREEREAVLQARGDVVHGALDRHRDPRVEDDLLEQLALVVRSGVHAALGDVAEAPAFLESGSAFLHRARRPELRMHVLEPP